MAKSKNKKKKQQQQRKASRAAAASEPAPAWADDAPPNAKKGYTPPKDRPTPCGSITGLGGAARAGVSSG